MRPFALSALLAVVSSTAATAQTTPDIERELRQRDAIIQQLQRRIEALEQRQQQQPPPQQPQPQPRAAAPARPGAAPPPPAAATAETDETVARALERSLVEQGGSLLPANALEIVPEVLYSHAGTNQLGVAGITVTGVTSRFDVLQTGATLRYGLPWDSQANLHVPFAINWSDVSALGRTTSRTDAALGDIDFGISKQILYERGWLPDGILNFQYKTSTGTADFSPAGRLGGTGTGFDSIGASLTLVKRQDPLVFLLGGSYTHVFSAEHSGLDFAPGEQIGVRGGTILAASAETALRFLLDTAFITKSSIDNVTIAGSDRVSSIFEIGVSSVLSPAVLLDIGVGIGLTKDSPDFRVLATLPIRLN